MVQLLNTNFTRLAMVAVHKQERRSMSGITVKKVIILFMLVIPICVAEVRSATGSGWFEVTTPLYSAVAFKDNARALLLIKKGADVNERNKAFIKNSSRFDPEMSETPLFAAIRWNNPMVRVLLDNGAMVNIKAPCFGTPLHCAIYEAKPEIVRNLIDCGADVNTVTEVSNTISTVGINSKCELSPLHMLFVRFRKKRVEDRTIMKMLIDKGADVNARELHSGYTVLHSASRNGNVELMKMLVENGADVNAHGIGQYSDITPLSCALECHDIVAVKYLCAQGAKSGRDEDVRLLSKMDDPLSSDKTQQSVQTVRNDKHVDSGQIERRSEVFRKTLALAVPVSYLGASVYMYEFRNKHDRSYNAMATCNAYSLSMAGSIIAGGFLGGVIGAKTGPNGAGEFGVYAGGILGAAAGAVVAHYARLPHRAKHNRGLYYGFPAALMTVSAVAYTASF